MDLSGFHRFKPGELLLPRLNFILGEPTCIELGARIKKYTWRDFFEEIGGERRFGDLMPYQVTKYSYDLTKGGEGRIIGRVDEEYAFKPPRIGGDERKVSIFRLQLFERLLMRNGEGLDPFLILKEIDIEGNTVSSRKNYRCFGRVKIPFLEYSELNKLIPDECFEEIRERSISRFF